MAHMAYEGARDLPKVCIVGAGCAGFTTAKRLKDFSIPYDCFEMSDDIGGMWYYRNPNGRSGAYESLHIDTSKWRLAFEDFPIPPQFPDFPHHRQLHGYFRDYVDHFGLRETIAFNTEVVRATRGDGGGWAVTIATGETRRYDALIVCNGHHWDPHLPNDYPGAFSGPQIHSHAYRDPFSPIDMRGKNVLIVGAGNSAMDIASELAQRPIAKSLFISMRRGVWVLPKYLNGQPADKNPAPAWMPLKLQKSIGRSIIKKAIGRMENYGLPKPDHEPLEAHASVSGEFLTRVGCGDIKPKPGLKAFEGDQVRFVDDSVEPIDVIVWATGYKVSFPFLTDPALQPKNNRFPLWKRMIKPGVDDLFFMGLAQPLPTLVNFPEQQSKLVARYLAGTYAPPSVEEMERQIVADEKLYLGDYYDSPRHTMQLDFGHYCRDLMKEIARGEARARAAGVRPVLAGRALREAV
jgi:cation diffusion facilitator CzcD-associated flavoprotein CzcO